MEFKCIYSLIFTDKNSTILLMTTVAIFAIFILNVLLGNVCPGKQLVQLN